MIMRFRILPFVDLSPSKSLSIRRDDYMMPAGLQREKQLVSKGQGFVQAGFVTARSTSSLFAGLRYPAE